jgi:pimeloyl-ACP methyl ester carboxylesterase
MTEPKTAALEVPGAVLHYELRGGAGPLLLLVGSPMGAAGFATLAGHFTNRTVLTYDPRGAERSRRTDGRVVSTPDEHADDLHRLITEVNDGGPVDVFGSSGGAVNALTLVARHPGQVRTLVAHEPPAARLLPDHEPALAACRDVHETYLSRGFGPAMAKFIALVSYQGPVPADYTNQPGPDPAMFGLPSEDDGSRDDPLLGQNMISCTHVELDLDALRAAATRVVPVAGVGSAGTLARRAAIALAERLDTPLVGFPGDHGGFLGGEYGQTGEPDAFAAKLREVLG